MALLTYSHCYSKCGPHYTLQQQPYLETSQKPEFIRPLQTY